MVVAHPDFEIQWELHISTVSMAFLYSRSMVTASALEVLLEFCPSSIHVRCAHTYHVVHVVISGGVAL
jgi:hypothetical protein